MEIRSDLITNLRTDFNKASSDWKYKPVKGINLVHYRNMIYVPKTICKRVLKWYQCYFQNPGGDTLPHTLTTICR